MIKTGCIAAALVAMLGSSAFAQMSLSDQIGAVSAAQTREQERQAAIMQERIAEQDAAQRRQAAIAHAAAQRQAAAQQQAHDEMLTDKMRDQHYEDQNREIEVAAKKLQLDALKARTARENEFIDQDLKRKAAVTDVVQSKADVNRNVGAGTERLLSGVGAGTARGSAEISHLP